MEFGQILLIAFFMVPGLVFYGSIYASLGQSVGERKIYDVLTLSAIGGTLSLSVWAIPIPILSNYLGIGSLIERIMSEPTLVEGFTQWHVLLHYFGILISAYAMGLGLAKFVLYVSKKPDNSVWRKSFTWLGPGYQQYLRYNEREANKSNYGRANNRSSKRHPK